MKTKIILIFILFVLSLFSQVEIEDDAFLLEFQNIKTKTYTAKL